jgi:hypothetical protein
MPFFLKINTDSSDFAEALIYSILKLPSFGVTNTGQSRSSLGNGFPFFRRNDGCGGQSASTLGAFYHSE